MKDRSEKDILKERELIIQFIRDKFHKKDIEILESYFGDDWATKEYKNKPLVFLGKSFEVLAQADLAVFAPNAPKMRGCRCELISCIEYEIPFMLLAYDANGKVYYLDND